MAFLPEVPEEKAEGKLKDLFASIRREFGTVPDFYRVQGITPQAAGAQERVFANIMSDGALSLKIKEQIAIVVSGLNTSSYCIALHMENLRTMGIEKKIGQKLAVDYANAPVEPNVLALFRLADKLTRHPADFSQADWEAGRAAGWSDLQLLEAVQVISAFNLANRISIGLGLMADF